MSDLLNIKDRNLEKEFIYRTSRSSGPGGQAVNKINTKVLIRFSVEESFILTEEEKSIIAEKLAHRINNDGYITVSSQKERSQLANKKRAANRLIEMIEKALTPKKVRKQTKKPKSLDEKRLSEKKKRSELKSSRKQTDNW